LDAVLDVASDQAGLARLAGLVREGGRVVSTKGAASQEAVTGRGLTAVDIRASITTAALSRLAALVAEGSLRLPEIRTVPLEQAGEALREVAAGRVRGKLVVRVA
jgi:NADPH:quinone reductase-like Zn-dependent oxidoreductase